MKKNNFIIMIICLMLFFSIASQQIQAQEKPKEYVKILFWVEDALGNRDSCWFIGTPTATDGIDEHLGEVNLYSIKPNGPVDIRIIQRTDVNFLYGDSADIGYWLVGDKCSHITGLLYGIPSQKQNIDLKVDCRWQWDTTYSPIFGAENIVLKINATNYPVNLYCQEVNGASVINFSLHNNIGECVDFYSKGLSVFDFNIDSSLLKPFYSVDSEYENYTFLIGYVGDIIGIKEKMLKISISPNPSNDYIFIENTEIENEIIKIFDINGKFIYSFILSENPYKLDISNFANGIYYLVNEKNILLNQFIKEK